MLHRCSAHCNSRLFVVRWLGWSSRTTPFGHWGRPSCKRGAPPTEWRLVLLVPPASPGGLKRLFILPQPSGGSWAVGSPALFCCTGPCNATVGGYLARGWVGHPDGFHGVLQTWAGWAVPLLVPLCARLFLLCCVPLFVSACSADRMHVHPVSLTFLLCAPFLSENVFVILIHLYLRRFFCTIFARVWQHRRAVGRWKSQNAHL